MKLQEALLSGKPFRRLGATEWRDYAGMTFNTHDVLYQEWEVKEEPREFWVYFDAEGRLVSWDKVRPYGEDSKGWIFVRQVMD